jgi:hypothetical protein
VNERGAKQTFIVEWRTAVVDPKATFALHPLVLSRYRFGCALAEAQKLATIMAVDVSPLKLGQISQHRRGQFSCDVTAGIVGLCVNCLRASEVDA